ncbi:MAG: hypothetical protein ACE5FV_11880 [Woeseia sp.]
MLNDSDAADIGFAGNTVVTSVAADCGATDKVFVTSFPRAVVSRQTTSVSLVCRPTVNYRPAGLPLLILR